MRVFWLLLTFGSTMLSHLSAQDNSSIRFSGRASYYGDFFHGRRTASGERFDIYKYTAAHRTLPFGTRVKVTNLHNNKSVIIKINDRGPHVKSRIIDLSKAAAKAIDLMRYGAARVSMEVLNEQSIALGPVKTKTGPDFFQNTAMYLSGNTYNYWGHLKNPEGYGFQIGAFTDLGSARESCQALLLKAVKEVYIQVASAGEGKLYRVMLYQFPSRKVAEEEIACLADLGLKGFIRQY
jgi:rare lipoprotein A